MTDPIPRYEESGPLTVCPCCGEAPAPEDAHDSSKSCARCWRLVGSIAYRSGTRATMAAEGVRLRREGKLPPLTSKPNFLEQLRAKSGEQVREAERWGVWMESHRLPDGAWVWNGNGSLFLGTRTEAILWADKCTGDARERGSDAIYTVKPYPDAKQTSETGSGALVLAHDPGRTSNRGGCSEEPRTETAPPLPQDASPAAAEGGAAKVDPYATHRLAGERRRAELISLKRKCEILIEQTQLQLEEIVGELDRLDRTGEVE